MAGTSRRKRLPRPSGPPPQWSERLYVRLPADKVALVRFLLEGYDNLAVLSILDRNTSLARFMYAPGSRAALLLFLEDIQELVEYEFLPL